VTWDGRERRSAPRMDAQLTFPPCAVCGDHGIGMSERCQAHQPKAPEWKDRWSGDRWDDLERSK